jgi:hypothetical protein
MAVVLRMVLYKGASRRKREDDEEHNEEQDEEQDEDQDEEQDESHKARVDEGGGIREGHKGGRAKDTTA